VPLTKILDTFTDTPGINARNHIADTGEAYTSAPFGPVFVIDPTGTKARAGVSTGTLYQLASGGFGGVQEIGDEVFADVRRADGPLASGHLSLMYLMDGAVSIYEYYYCQFGFTTNVNEVNVQFHRVQQGVTSESSGWLPGLIPLAQLATLRLGITIKGDDEHEVWYEPAGGGARTAFGSWTPAPNPIFTGWVGDNVHKWIGLFSGLNGFEPTKTEVDNLTLLGGGTDWSPCVPAPGAVTKFQDTFTDANGTVLDVHSADFPVGEGWQSAGGNLMDIQSDEVVNNWNGSGNYVAQTDGAVGIAYAIGDEVFADVEREEATDGYGQGFAFFGDGANNYVVLWIENINATDIGFGGYRFTGGFVDHLDADDPLMPTIPLAPGSKIRLGITIIDGTHIEVWTEPVGGGTRTVHFLVATLNTDANGHWVLTSDLIANDRVGLFTRAFGAPSNGRCNKDNLTVQTPAGTDWDPCEPAMGATTWESCP